MMTRHAHDDAPAGGSGRYEWRGTNGENMVMTAAFDEVEPGVRTVHREVFAEDWTGGEATILTEYKPSNGGTDVLMTITYSSTEAREAVFKSGAWGGMESGYSRLDEMLAT